MPARARGRRNEPAAVEPKDFASVEEIDRGIGKLERRITELEQLDVLADRREDTGRVQVVHSNVVETIREIFGSNSPEFHNQGQFNIWAGPMRIGMSPAEIVEGEDRGRARVAGILRGLIDRLKEKRADLASAGPRAPAVYYDELNLHPRILEVTRDLFKDGHHWEAVFAGAKALVNYVKERSGRFDLDGAPLVRAVFSRNAPILAFNALGDQTEMDEQEGMMHLFEGAVLAIRNPGGHGFPGGTEQRALEYVQLLSLLAYRTQEARRV